MDWREEDLEAEGYAPGADKAFCILHEAPAVPTARQAKAGGKAAGPTADELGQQKLLAHHPALYPGEPEEFRLRRAGAHQACWEALTARMQVCRRARGCGGREAAGRPAAPCHCR